MDKCILNPKEFMGCTVIWAPSGVGKTLTICNLMDEACSKVQDVNYVRINWAKYTPSKRSMQTIDWDSDRFIKQDMQRWMHSQYFINKHKQFTFFFHGSFQLCHGIYF